MNSENEPTSLRNIPITQRPIEDRPREKMLAHGKKSLTDSELLAILIRTGIPGASATEIAMNILQQANGSITELARMEINDLRRLHKGLGTTKAITVLAALELGNRMLKEEKENKEDIIGNSQDLFHFIAHRIIDQPHEEFWAVYLNQRNKVTWNQCIASGGLTQTTVDMRILFRAALEHNAVKLAVAHNHPSGNLQPSNADKELTRRIAEAGNALQVKLLDHIIVGINPNGKRDYYSFSESGLL